jgi:hypothetical protein
MRMVKVEMRNKEGKEKKKGGKFKKGNKDKRENSYTQHKRINQYLYQQNTYQTRA